MFCTNCGNQIPDGSKFCPKCGAAVASAEKASGGVAPGDAGGVTGAATTTAPYYAAQPQVAPDQANGSVPYPAAQPSNKGPKVSRRGFVIGGVATAAAVAGLAIAARGIGGASGTSPNAETSNDGAAAAVSDGGSDEVTVQDSVDGYSWDELSAIADQIAKASSDDDGLNIAKKYHLCGDDGKLDGTQLKSFGLSDGTKAQAQIIGFRHDDLADGSGKAGITFITKDCVAKHEMNGPHDVFCWEKCGLRSWMNSELINEFPNDFSSAIVPVLKMTNNIGHEADASSVTKTEDSLWLPSLVELLGEGQIDSNNWGDYSAVLSAEGSQYRLYLDEDVQMDYPNDVLAKEWDGGATIWWLRSFYFDYTCYFFGVYSDGDPNNNFAANKPNAVAPCFCL